MSLLPQQSLSLSGLIGKALEGWPRTFKASFSFVLMMLVLRLFMVYFPYHSIHYMIGNSIILIILFLQIFVWGALLFSAYEALSNNAFSWKEMIARVYNRYWSVVLGIVTCTLIIGLLTFLGYWIGVLVMKHVPESSHLQLLGVIFVGFPSLYSIVLLLFVSPIILLEKKGVFQAIGYSCRLTGKHWFLACSAYLTMLIVMGVIYFAQIIHRLLSVPEWLAWLGEIAIFFFLVPWCINYFLLVLNQLELRLEAKP